MKQKLKTLMPWILTLASAAMGIVAFFLIFAPSVKYDFLILGNNTFTGINVTLGYTINKTTTVFQASAGMIFAFLLPLLGACVAVVGKDSFIARIVATAMFLTGGALSFAATALVKPAFLGNASLALGSIFSGVIALLGGIAEGATCVLYRK